MIEATALSYAAIREILPEALSSGETTWIISIPAKVDGHPWQEVLGTVVMPYVTAERAILFEEIGKLGDRVAVMVGVRRRASAVSPSAL